VNQASDVMSPAEIRTEMQYRIQERIGIMVGDMDVPPVEVVNIAIAEAEQWKRDYEAQTKTAPGAD